MPPDPAVRLLTALRAAGCNVFIDDDHLYCSPPLRHVDWDDGDVEAAIDEWNWDLKELVEAEGVTIH